jgi:predicted amidohydrolase
MPPSSSELTAASQPVPTLRVAALQMVSTPRVDENLRTAAALMARPWRRGQSCLRCRNTFAIMGMSDRDKVRVREHDGPRPDPGFPGSERPRTRRVADRRLAPAVGDSPDKVLNSSLVYDPHGQCVARYDKIHLFGFRQGAEAYDESATIEAGRQPVAFSTPFGRVGLSICYDLRFPELYRALGVTELLVIPAAFTETTGRAHWEILLRARAIENQCARLKGPGVDHR